MDDPSQLGEMLQRLMTRLDYLEFNALQKTQSDAVDVHERVDLSRVDLADLQHTVEKMRREKRLEDQQARASAPQAVATHRGPGALPSPAPASGQPQALAPAASVPSNPFAIGSGCMGRSPSM